MQSGCLQSAQPRLNILGMRLDELPGFYLRPDSDRGYTGKAGIKLKGCTLQSFATYQQEDLLRVSCVRGSGGWDRTHAEASMLKVATCKVCMSGCGGIRPFAARAVLHIAETARLALPSHEPPIA